MSERGKQESLSFNTSAWVFDPDKADTRFLGLHTLDDIKVFVVKSGLDRHLRDKGLYPYDVKIGVDDEGLWLLLVTLPGDDQLPLIDFRVSRVRKSGPLMHTPFDLLKIEWLSTFDPTQKTFSEKRPRLPGQKVPGLGCLRHLLKMMHFSSQTLRMDGFLDIPEHLHLAIMYAKSFRFLDPVCEKILRTLLGCFKGETLFRISWAAVAGAIIDVSTGLPWVYRPAEQAFAISHALRAYYSSKEYLEGMDFCKTGPFVIDNTLFQKNVAFAMSRG